MKTIEFDRKVSDVPSLYFDLIKAEFEVSSIAVHEQSTLIYLEDEEDKDPLPIAAQWANGDEKAPSRSTMLERQEIYRKFQDEKPLRMENLRARMSRDGARVSVMDRDPEMLALSSAPKESWFSKLRKLW